MSHKLDQESYECPSCSSQGCHFLLPHGTSDRVVHALRIQPTLDLITKAVYHVRNCISRLVDVQFVLLSKIDVIQDTSQASNFRSL